MNTRYLRGLGDTNILIHLERLAVDQLPSELATSTVSLAELSAGIHATEDTAERSRRILRVQRVEATFTPLPFDVEAARQYGVIAAKVISMGRKPRGRIADLMIASIAAAAVVVIGLLLLLKPAVPVVEGISQITDDGYPKVLSAVVSDGSRVYFNEIRDGTQVLAQVVDGCSSSCRSVTRPVSLWTAVRCQASGATSLSVRAVCRRVTATRSSSSSRSCSW